MEIVIWYFRKLRYHWLFNNRLSCLICSLNMVDTMFVSPRHTEPQLQDISLTRRVDKGSVYLNDILRCRALVSSLLNYYQSRSSWQSQCALGYQLWSPDLPLCAQHASFPTCFLIYICQRCAGPPGSTPSDTFHWCKRNKVRGTVWP